MSSSDPRLALLHDDAVRLLNAVAGEVVPILACMSAAERADAVVVVLDRSCPEGAALAAAILTRAGEPPASGEATMFAIPPMTILREALRAVKLPVPLDFDMPAPGHEVHAFVLVPRGRVPLRFSISPQITRGGSA